MKSDMTITEFCQKKECLESDILALIRKFSDETNNCFSIEDIDIKSDEYMDGTQQVRQVKIDGIL